MSQSCTLYNSTSILKNYLQIFGYSNPMEWYSTITFLKEFSNREKDPKILVNRGKKVGYATKHNKFEK